MAKVKIQGHTSGTGVLTVTAPNTSTDRTITLPDATATIATTTDVAARLPSITDGGNATAITIDSDENVEIASTVNPRAVKLYTKGNADIMDGSLVFSKPDSGTYNWRVLPNNITTGDLTFQVTSDTNTNETTQASTFVTKLQLTADGHVGIGVTPESGWNANYSALQIGSVGSLYGYTAVTDGAEVVLGCNEYTGKYITADQASHYVQYDGMHIFRVAASGSADAAISWTTAMTIDNSGNTVWGTGSTGNQGKRIDASGGKFKSFVDTTSTDNHFWFINPNSVVGSIQTSGSSTTYNTSSDYRLKENVVPLTGSIDRLKELKPSKFNFIADADTTVDGFLAHEVSDYVPEAISGEKDAMQTEEYEVEPAVLDDDGEVVTEAVMGEREVIDPQGIDQSKLVPLLVSALQEAITRIETLEAE